VTYFGAAAVTERGPAAVAQGNGCEVTRLQVFDRVRGKGEAG